MITPKKIKISRKKQAGSLSIEMIVAVGIMAALFSVLAAVGNSFKKVNDHRWARHTMIAAGQAQMDAIAVTGKPIEKATFKRLWPKVKCTVEISKGENLWQGLRKVELHLSAKSHGKTVKTSLTRYIPADKELQI
ncbi:MAG: type II secretion system protein [Phycisphaerae bacterium]|nr:type II secretion system protein [Phycisphaerae bacterium]